MIKKKPQTGKIIIPTGMKPRPRGYEIGVAEVLVEYFGVDVEFVKTSERKTPDFLIDGVLWELKSPQGKGKHNIDRQLKYAKHQSANVIIDASRSKMQKDRIRREVEYQFKINITISRLIFVSKDKKVVEIKR